MFKGFRDFILRGNVIELATAVIIGGAFTAIVTAVSDKIINPLIAAIGSPEVGGLGFRIRPEVPETFVDFGAVITAAINFLIIAAVVYFIIIMPMNRLNEWRNRNAEEEDVPATSEELLTEIRDLLVVQNQSAGLPGEAHANSVASPDADTEFGEAGKH